MISIYRSAHMDMPVQIRRERRVLKGGAESSVSSGQSALVPITNIIRDFDKRTSGSM